MTQIQVELPQKRTLRWASDYKKRDIPRHAFDDVVGYVKAEANRFFMLQLMAQSGSPEQENFRGQYSMACRTMEALRIAATSSESTGE